MTNRHKEFPCAGCGYKIDSTTMPGDPTAVPEEGHLSLCVRCATISIFTFTDGEIGTRLATPEELAEIMQDPEVVQSKIIVLKMILSTL